MTLLISGSLLRVAVEVDGRSIAVPARATVAGVLRAADAMSHTGRLLSAKDGRVVATSGGTAARVRLNGKAASLGAHIEAGDSLVVVQGSDVVEKTIIREVRVPAPRVTVGTGEDVTHIAAGRDGLKREVVGAVTGDVLSTRTLKTALPRVDRQESLSRRVVALTFDDGPSQGQTEEVIAILRAHHVPATFFMLGRNVVNHPDIVASVAAAGNLIGNHSYTHTLLGHSSAREVRTEIARTNEAVQRAAAVTPTWFRPPGGSVDDALYAASRQMHVKPVLWTVDPQDWRGIKASTIADRISVAVRPGAVILLHDGGGDRTQTIKALPRIIKRLRVAGYTFVTLDELPAIKGRW